MAPLASVSESTDPRRRAFAALKAGWSGAGEPARLAVEPALASGIPALDRLLGGGFPNGTLVTLEGPLGRWSVAAALAARATRRGLVAVLDDGGLYPPGLVEAGVRLDRLLVLAARSPRSAARAADILVRARICRLVVMSAVVLPAVAWMRLAGLAHRSGTLLIAIATQAAAPLAAAAGVRLHCRLERVSLQGEGGVWGKVAGFSVRAELCKHKRRAPGAQADVRSVVPLIGIPERHRALEPANVSHAVVR